MHPKTKAIKAKRNQVSLAFIISSEELIPAEITRAMKVKPSWSFKKGEKRSRVDKSLRYPPWGVWGWTSDEFIRSKNIVKHVLLFLKTFESKADVIAQYLVRSGYCVAIRLDWQTKYLEGGYRISASLIRRLSALCDEFDFVYLIKE